jgi:hypothetical protein
MKHESPERPQTEAAQRPLFVESQYPLQQSASDRQGLSSGVQNGGGASAQLEVNWSQYALQHSTSEPHAVPLSEHVVALTQTLLRESQSPLQQSVDK